MLHNTRWQQIQSPTFHDHDDRILKNSNGRAQHQYGE